MKIKWKSNSNEEAVTTGEVVKSLVDGAPDYYDGAVESLRAETRKLTCVVAALIDTLPASAQREVLEKVGNYEFTEVKP